MEMYEQENKAFTTYGTCPFCKHNDNIVIQEKPLLKNCYRVCCNNCYTRGPEAETKNLAITKWINGCVSN